jgi:Asp-tRNA(Asn)/Glu-tRNA(Gln) amidotransferase A subunit family amidase
MKAYEDCDALDLAQLVASGRAGPRELLDEAVARARSIQEPLNAMSQLFPERGRAAVDAGLPDGPFRGVPFLLKDIVAMAGTTTRSGSRLAAKLPPAEVDATIVERFKRAGVVIFGKTTTPELGIAASTETSLTGTTRNPWDPARTPGGSSGGSAVAVAARVVPMAHGSDGGGSIRTPASCCGLFGLKPTRARNPYGPLAGEGWGSLAAHHVLTRSVRDSAAMLDATHGPAPGDPYCAPPVGGRFLDEVGRNPGPLKVAVQHRPFSGVPVDGECTAAVNSAARLLEELGHTVEEAMPELEWPELASAHWVLVATNLRLSVLLMTGGKEPPPGALDSVVQEAVDFARSLPGEAYPRALRTIHLHGRRMAAFHARYDILMSPTTARPAVALGPQHTNHPDLKAYREAILGFSAFTSPANHSGQPGMSVPLYWTPDGVPVGVMFCAAFGNEALLFRLAGQLEAARPWVGRKPPILAKAST